MFVGVTTAANAGVPAETAGLAASLLNASQQLGGALGLAIFSAVATARTDGLLAHHTAADAALTAGFQRAFLVGSLFVLASAVLGLKATNTRGEAAPAVPGLPYPRARRRPRIGECAEHPRPSPEWTAAAGSARLE